MAYMVELKKKQPWKYVLQEFTSKLAQASTGQCTPSAFGNELVSNNFLSLGAMTKEVNVLGVGSDSIVLKLLAAVSSHINTAGSADVSTQHFAKLMTILSDLGLYEIADQMIKKFHEYSPDYHLPDVTPKASAEPATTTTPEPGENFGQFKWRDGRGQVNVYHLAAVFSPDWKLLGEMFGFHQTLLTNIATRHRDNPEPCFNDVISHWESNGSVPQSAYPVTWEDLIQALRGMGKVSREVDKLEATLKYKL